MRLTFRTITFLALAAGGVAPVTAAGVVPASAAHVAAPVRSVIGTPGGTQLWAAKYPGGTDNGAATALAVSPDQAAVYVTGAVTKTGGAHRALVAYDAATGARLWAVTYPLLHISRFQPPGAPTLAVSPDGSAVFTEDNSRVRDNGETSVRAFGATSGAQLWLAKLSAMRFWGGPKTIAVSPDGSQVFVTGTATGTGGSGEYSTMGYSTATGSRLWTVQYEQAGASSAPVALGVSTDGSSVFVTGTSTPATGHSQFATVAYGS